MPAVKTEIGNGLECRVYDVGNGRCYKEYRFAGDTKSAYKSAKLAFEVGIGPEVYERDKNGYYTEIVETFDYLCDDCPDEYNCEDICKFAFDMIGHREYQELCAALCEVFGVHADTDLHIHNIGRKNGKLVAIDFGKESGIE